MTGTAGYTGMEGILIFWDNSSKVLEQARYLLGRLNSGWR